MNDDYTFYQDRRRFMKGTGSMLALGSLPAYLTANANDLKVTLGELQQHQGIVVYREDDVHSVAFADTMAKAGLKTVALTDDLVRQWRDGLGEAVSKSGTPLLGLTSWPDYLLLSGLAFEARKYPLLELQHAVEQPGKANWSASLALDYMHLPVTSDRQIIQEMAQQHLSSQSIAPKTPSLFSWLIG
jgi:hypothetical protein